MLEDKPSIERIPGYCALCVSRCGSIAVVENGHIVALEPDPSHPLRHSRQGRAAPAVYHSDRLVYPLKRTRRGRRPGLAAYQLGRNNGLTAASCESRQNTVRRHRYSWSAVYSASTTR
jgi:anaerobic selenocysteine-containing dehydrogenase